MEVHHLPHDRGIAIDQIIGEYHAEGLVTDHRLCAQNGMPQAQRFGLPDVDAINVLGKDIAHHPEQVFLAPCGQFAFDFIRLVEMIFDRAFVAPGDENHVRHACAHGLLHCVLDQRLVNDRHHFFRTRLGGRKKPAAHAGHGKHDFRNFPAHFVSFSESGVNSFMNELSSRTGMPRLRALSSLPPASSPDSTKSVLLDTDPVTLPPIPSIRLFA